MLCYTLKVIGQINTRRRFQQLLPERIQSFEFFSIFMNLIECKRLLSWVALKEEARGRQKTGGKKLCQLFQ